MGPAPGKYLLRILFDHAQIEASDLQVRVERLLCDYPPGRIHVEVRADASSNPVLSIRGSLEDVDVCHAIIDESLIRRCELSFARLVDEAGAEIRTRAYPTLAQIEQHLRAFVDHVGIAVIGFDSWRELLHALFRNRIDALGESHLASPMSLSPLECCQFDDLVDLITREYSYWESGKTLSIAELLGILGWCSSINELRAALEEKTQKVSLWDQVFARRFSHRDDWDSIKKDVGFVVRMRHSVMHHRPVRLAAIQALKDKERELSKALSTVDLKVSDEDRSDAQEGAKMFVSRATASSALAASLSLSWPALDLEACRRQTERINQMMTLPAMEALRRSLAALDLEAFRRQTERINQMMTLPAMEALRKQTELIGQMRSLAALDLEAFRRQIGQARTGARSDTQGSIPHSDDAESRSELDAGDQSADTHRLDDEAGQESDEM